ncbi:MAG TPA: hypothetical protein VK462_04645 [Nitrososphaeraceae archaeon]|nr:hypothetical protein [Nitrososphaeraceae archaeon]
MNNNAFSSNPPKMNRGVYQSKGGSGVSGGRGGASGDVIQKGQRAGQIQQFTPEQLQMFSQLFGQIGPESDIFKMASGDQSYFDEMEKPALRDFGALQGNIASRFSGQGMGARRSSGFQNTMNKEGSDFAQRLAANRQGLSRQALKDLFEMSHMLMNEKPFERTINGKRQKQPGFWEQAGSSFAQSAGRTAGEKIFGGGSGGDLQNAAMAFGG